MSTTEAKHLSSKSKKLKQYLIFEEDLHNLFKQGLDDSPAGELLANQMDKMWRNELSNTEQDFVIQMIAERKLREGRANSTAYEVVTKHKNDLILKHLDKVLLEVLGGPRGDPEECNIIAAAHVVTLIEKLNLTEEMIKSCPSYQGKLDYFNNDKNLKQYLAEVMRK